MLLWVPFAAAVSWSDALATGDCGTVLSALPAPEAEVERLARGRCLVATNQPDAVDDLLAPVTGDLAPWAKFVRAEALVARGHAGEALPLLDGLGLIGPADELLRGQALVAAGKPTDALAVLTPLVDGSSGDEARFWSAAALWDSGRKAEATTAWEKLWAEKPTSAWADRAAERLAAAGVTVPDASTEAGRTLVRSRVNALLTARQAVPAVGLLDLLRGVTPLQPTSTEKRQYANALFDAKLYARAAQAYAECGGVDGGASTAFRYALSTARAGDFDAAEALYAKVVAKYPGTPEADEATWKPGYMAHDAGRLDEAVAGFETYLRKYPTGRFAADARWLWAWDQYKLGHADLATKGFDRVLSVDAGSETAAAAAYWKARSTDDLVALRDVMRKYPDTSYAWYAAWRLGVDYPSPTAPARPEFPKAFTDPRPLLRIGLVLAGAGMADWGRPLVEKSVADAKTTQATALPMAWTLVDAEDFVGAKALACPYRSTPAGAWACTPRPHHEALEAIAKAHGLDPLLPYAIMNTESGLDPSVTSPAGARGLMQLMPALATELAADELPGFAIDDLYRAGVNARLGTTELGRLAGRFRTATVQPSLPLVVAGYNGGGDAVARWLATYTTAPEPDRFAEDISYTETRRYVRRVLGYLMGYRRVYGDHV